MSLLARRRAMMGAKSEQGLPDQPIGVNLITNIIPDYRFVYPTGELSYNTSYMYCDYIPIYPEYGYIYRCNHPTQKSATACCYDKDKNFISAILVSASYQNATLSSIVNQPGAAYIRLSTSKTGGDGSTTFEVYRSAT